MDIQNSNTSPISPQSDVPESLIIQSLHPNFKNKILVFLALLLILPGVLIAIRYKSSLNSSAKGRTCISITKININPGTIRTSLSSPATEISALAYDANDQPIVNQVQYQWGMSSTNSIGDLKPKQEIALFVPKQTGTGNIWVTAKNPCTKEKVQTSVPVTVSQTLPPTNYPLTTPTPTLFTAPTRQPTLTPPPQISITP